jgi:hypothetical protein
MATCWTMAPPQREADERHGWIADRLDQLGGVARERLERPRQRDVARRRADPTVVEARAAEVGLEKRHLIRVPVRRQAAAARHPHDVGPGAVLGVVGAGL